MAKEMNVVGLDIARPVFRVHGVDRHGHAVLQKRLRLSQVEEFFRQVRPCVIGMEATGGAHYWAQILTSLGHEVRLMPPQSVKPYLKSQRNGTHDAEAICKAVNDSMT